MEYVGAFFVAAIICTVAQLLIECLKDVHGPTLFILLQVAGAVLVPLGTITALQEVGAAGMIITIFNAGGTVCLDIVGMFNGDSAFALCQLIGVFCVVAAFGLIAGALRIKVLRVRK